MGIYGECYFSYPLLLIYGYFLSVLLVFALLYIHGHKCESMGYWGENKFNWISGLGFKKCRPPPPTID